MCVCVCVCGVVLVVVLVFCCCFFFFLFFFFFWGGGGGEVPGRRILEKCHKGTLWVPLYSSSSSTIYQRQPAGCQMYAEDTKVYDYVILGTKTDRLKRYLNNLIDKADSSELKFNKHLEIRVDKASRIPKLIRSYQSWHADTLSLSRYVLICNTSP